MKIDSLEVYMEDVDLEDIMSTEYLAEVIHQAVVRAVRDRVERDTRDIVRDKIQSSRDELRERIEAKIKPRLDAILRDALERMDNMDDEQLLEEALL